MRQRDVEIAPAAVDGDRRSPNARTGTRELASAHGARSRRAHAASAMGRAGGIGPLDNSRDNDYSARHEALTHPMTQETMPEGSRGRRAWRFETVETEEREIYLLLQHLSGELIHELATLLRPSGITPEQYHVLRILRDAGREGTQLSEIAARSPAGDPDVTRMLDRLEQRGLARRAREAADRRVITARLTSEGMGLLEKLEDPVAALHARQIGPLGDRGMRDLRKLLQKVAEVGPVI